MRTQSPGRKVSSHSPAAVAGRAAGAVSSSNSAGTVSNCGTSSMPWYDDGAVWPASILSSSFCNAPIWLAAADSRRASRLCKKLSNWASAQRYKPLFCSGSAASRSAVPSAFFSSSVRSGSAGSGAISASKARRLMNRHSGCLSWSSMLPSRSVRRMAGPCRREMTWPTSAGTRSSVSMASNSRLISSMAWRSTWLVVLRATSLQCSRLAPDGAAGTGAWPSKLSGRPGGAGMVSRMRCRSGLKVASTLRGPRREPAGNIKVR